jgi:glutamine amidotransferase
MIAIVDYGVGNLRSVERALTHVGARPKLTSDLADLARANGIVLPGVGAFAPALERLQVGNEGLGLLRGRVVQVQGTARLPVIGWCRVRQTDWSPLFQGIADDAYFYFVHSYAPASSVDAVAATEHSPAAAGMRLNVMGTQFHPEKSGANGLGIYANFLAVCGDG